MTPNGPADPLEAELRRALADEAADPAPDRLAVRIARIPGEGRPGRFAALGSRRPSRWPTLGRLGLAFAALVVVVAVLARQGGTPGPSPVGGAGAAPASSAPSASVPASTSAVPSASTTSVPSAVSPSATPVPGPTGGVVPADFSPVSVSFVSADLGWLLGSATCAGSPCAAIVRTADGGRTWASVPAPAAAIVTGSGSATKNVSALRFATALDGWAFGPDLWATHDGGATWRQIALPGTTTGSGVMALESAAGAVHAAYYTGDGGAIQIATSAIGSDSWSASPTTVPIGAGPVPHAQLVLQGTSGWLVENDRVVVGGARLVAGAWQPWRPPCAALNGPVTLAASSTRDLVAACDIGRWATPKGVHLFTSADGGTSFTESPAQVPVLTLDAVGAPSASAPVVAGSLSGGGSGLVESTDGGATWRSAYLLQGGGAFSDLGFTTRTQGVVITTAGDGSSGALVMTTDAGRTWSPVQIAGP